MKNSILTSVLLFSSNCAAWGALGHDTIAYVASKYVTAATKAHFQSILGDTSDNYLASVATWADSYRYTTAGKYSAPFHYIDAQDDPPTTCDVVYSRDCGTGGCVVSAINNYTTRVQSTTLSAAELAIAAKMLVHFIGDIHQPLHDENLDVGGNSISVLFDGATTNLHAVWDTSIPEKLVGGYTLAYASTWATNLTSSITTAQAKSWVSGMKLSDPVTTAMSWASDANAYVCSVVLVGGVSAVSGEELSGAYYDGAVGTVEGLVSRAGVRLAGWLNLIVTGAVGI